MSIGAENRFVILFSGLSLGEHWFEFDIGKEVFEDYDNEAIIDANLGLSLRLMKEERIMSFEFRFKGNLVVLCDLCLEDLVLEIDGVDNLYVRFGEEFLETDEEDIIVIPYSEYKINLEKYINEFLLLKIPMKHVHKEGECNNEMLDRLSVDEDDSDEIEIDPRWSALEKLKIDKE